MKFEEKLNNSQQNTLNNNIRNISKKSKKYKSKNSSAGPDVEILMSTNSKNADVIHVPSISIEINDNDDDKQYLKKIC